MKYFAKFPKIVYDITGNGNVKLVPDIFRRIKVRSKIRDNVSLFDKYDVDEGESPETVSYKIYGSTDYFWVICLMNDIVNRYHDWPLDEYNFQQFVANKYDNPGDIHHYEVTQNSGPQKGDGPSDYSHKIHVNSDYIGAESVSNIEYERRLQDEKRQIRVLPPNLLGVFEQEFNKLLGRN